MSESHRILIVEDNEMMRESLQMLVEVTPSLEFVGSSGQGGEALELLQDTEADLVLVDLSLPDMSGLDLVRQLGQERPEIYTLVISGHDESEFTKPALEAGARGFVQKGMAGKLREAIETVLRGETYTTGG